MNKKEFIELAYKKYGIKANGKITFEQAFEIMDSINSNEPNEFRAVGNNENTQEFCVICGKELTLADAISGACGNCNWQLD
jgi:hypothetical protein